MFVIPAEAGIQKVDSPGFPLPAFAGSGNDIYFNPVGTTYESLTPMLFKV